MPQKSHPPAADSARCNLPIPQAQPERLAAIVRARGMQPRDVRGARVLEIGCGCGSNLLPLAERYPESRFLGVDGASEQIAAAQEIAAAIGLPNVEFRQQTAWEFGDEDPFDYIVAPDVYSWVDAASRDRLLAACARHLSPMGIAYINTNVYPGWYTHELLGTMMRYEARAADSDAKRLAAGRMLLDFLSATLPADDGGYGTMLRDTLEPIRRQPDGIVLRNYLGQPGHAAYFTQFAAHAKRHALQAVGDAGLGIRASDYLPLPQEDMLKAVAADPNQREQYRDILQNKAHRQTLLCHAGVTLEEEVTSSRLRGMYLEARLRPENPDEPVESSRPCKFVGPDGLAIATAAPAAKAALAHLGSVWPNYVLFEDLVAAAQTRIEGDGKGKGESSAPQVDVARLEETLLHCCVPGIVQVHGAAQEFVGSPSVRPAASRLAHWQAAHDDVSTNRRHQPVRLDPFDRYVVALLDGTRTVEQLVEHLTVSAAAGQIALVEEGQPVPVERNREFALSELTASLNRLAENALLIA